MNMLFRLTAATVLIGASTLALARPHGPPAPEQRVERLTSELQLSDAQQSAILEILQAAAPDPEQRAQACAEGKDPRAMREAIDQEIVAVLDEAQRERFAALKAERPDRPERPADGGRRRHAPCD